MQRSAPCCCLLFFTVRHTHSSADVLIVASFHYHLKAFCWHTFTFHFTFVFSLPSVTPNALVFHRICQLLFFFLESCHHKSAKYTFLSPDLQQKPSFISSCIFQSQSLETKSHQSSLFTWPVTATKSRDYLNPMHPSHTTSLCIAFAELGRNRSVPSPTNSPSECCGSEWQCWSDASHCSP